MKGWLKERLQREWRNKENTRVKTFPRKRSDADTNKAKRDGTKTFFNGRNKAKTFE